MAAVSENRMKWQRKTKWQDFYRLPVLPLRHLNRIHNNFFIPAGLLPPDKLFYGGNCLW